jgi:putative transposase
MIDLPGSTYYFKPAEESALNLRVMRIIDEAYTERPFYGKRRLLYSVKQQLVPEGIEVNVKRVSRLMNMMGLETVHPKTNLSRKAKDSVIHPYLLRGLTIDPPNQVWASDIMRWSPNAGVV